MASDGETTIRGWGCTPTGDMPAAAMTGSEPPAQTTCIPASLKRGWRRTTLYVILGILMLIIFINLSLTLWIIATLRLSMNSVGPIKIVRGGIKLQGQAYITDSLIASSIKSRPGQPLAMYAHRNFSVQVNSSEGQSAKLLIKRDTIECAGQAFVVSDARGESIFQVSREEVRVAAETLQLDGSGGVVVKTGIQAPLVRAPPGSDLELESQTRSLDLRAPQSITLESRAGNIDITSHKDIKMYSTVGALKINTSNIIFSNLKIATPVNKQLIRKGDAKSRIYQLCACASGKLFLAAPDSICASHADDDELCR